MSPYEVGSKLEVPGLEAVMEYGSIDDVRFDRILNAYRINDRNRLERAHLSNITGLHDDPDGRDTREARSDTHGERAGRMFYGGRTIGLTGKVEAGSISRMRDEWRRFRSQFNTSERDLLVHSPPEVPSFVNELTNPSFDVDASGWTSNSTSGSPVVAGAVAEGNMLVGSVTATLTAGGAIWAAQSLAADWAGEDVFLLARVKVHSTTATVTQVSLDLSESEPSDLGVVTAPFQKAFQNTPVTGTWYPLLARVSGAAMDKHLLTKIGLGVSVTTSNAGTVVLRVDRCMLVLLRSTDATPAGYFDGDNAGFEWLGVAHRSKSAGPYYATNMIHDPRFVDVSTAGTPPPLLTWVNGSDGSVTVNRSPVPSRLYAGVVVGRSAYFKATKDATATARVIGIRSIHADDSLSEHNVSQGRTYKFSCLVNVLQLPPTGALAATISWYDITGTLISRSAGATLAAGVSSTSVQAAAPVNAVGAIPSVTNAATTTSGAVLELFVTDPIFCDVTSYDPGLFVGDGSTPEVDCSVIKLAGGVVGQRGARRFIPRPWLVRGVRQTSDAKAPEQQSDAKAWRDFTMSLRASDPRIYALDERRRQLQMVGTPNFVVRQPPTDFTLNTTVLPVPAGWTYEGNVIPGTGGTWQQWAWNYQLGSNTPQNHPNLGVGPTYWGSDGLRVSRPANPIVVRMYRSAEAFTYAQPRVVLGCAPQGAGHTSTALASNGGPNSLGPDGRVMAFQRTSTNWYNNYVSILLKRIDATTWLELRWNSMSNAFAQASQGFAGPNTFELWSSHSNAGALATTKLAGWDYTSVNAVQPYHPFNPSKDPMYLVAWMASDSKINWELWSAYPSPIDFSRRLEVGSFTPAAGLIAVSGAAVAGSAGAVMSISNGNAAGGYGTLLDTPPFMHYFESSKADVPPVTMTVPVIGDIDTPQQIKLRGDLVDPIVSVTVPALDDLPSFTSVARFSGTIDETNPIVVDLADDGSIKDALGVNRHSLMLPGSDFATLRPGLNYVTVQAKSWGAFSAHAVTSWRDARK